MNNPWQAIGKIVKQFDVDRDELIERMTKAFGEDKNRWFWGSLYNMALRIQKDNKYVKADGDGSVFTPAPDDEIIVETDIWISGE